jgi:hypothetical protein
MISRLSPVAWSPQGRWRLACGLGVVLLLLLLLLLRGFYRRELYHLTGSAEWMWVTGEVNERRPLSAVFSLPIRLRDHPTRAVAKVCGDRQYVLWVNGQPAAAGRSRPGFHLDVVPVTDLLASGPNLIAVEARSPTLVGAVLFALDLYPTREGRRAGDPSGRAAVVSGAHWRVSSGWRPGQEGRVPADGVRPWIWGRPPDHPWSYPTPVRHQRPLIQALVAEPVRLAADDFREAGPARWVAKAPRRVSGIMWLGLRQAWDSGGTTARVVLSSEHDSRSDPVEVVSLAGQRRWLYPERIDGDVVEVIGPSPPEYVELVESVETRIK